MIKRLVAAAALFTAIGVASPATAQPAPRPGIETAQVDRQLLREQRRAARQAVRPQCQAEARSRGLRGPMNREARRAFVRACVRGRVG